MRDLHGLGQKIAERVASAWSGSFSGHDVGVPLGAVAALTLLGRQADDAPHPAEQLLDADDETVTQLLADVWCMFTILRPELAFRCGPFGRWLNEESRNGPTASGAAAAVRAAVKAGLLDVTLDREAAREVDVLGYVHQELRSSRAKQAQGQFYTPAPVAEFMARMSVGAAEPGQSICDPTAGTGGLLRAAGQALRAEGKDPYDYWWYACDIDAVAVAALSVNFHVWDLGPRVVVGCANVLAEAEWERRAVEEQRTAIAAQHSRMAFASMLATLRAVERRNGSSPE